VVEVVGQHGAERNRTSQPTTASGDRPCSGARYGRGR
jgi:hypothetical protein